MTLHPALFGLAGQIWDHRPRRNIGLISNHPNGSTAIIHFDFIETFAQDVLGKVAGLIYVLAGTDHTLCPPAWNAAIAAQSSRASFVAIIGAGHWVPLEQPSAFTRAISGWLINLETTPKQEINA